MSEQQTDSLDSYVERCIAEAPPLAPEQRSRLAALLVPEQGR